MKVLLQAAAVLAALFVSAAQAQYPQRPIQLIVPWGAGGGTDATVEVDITGFDATVSITSPSIASPSASPSP